MLYLRPTLFGQNEVYQIVYKNVLYFLVNFLIPLISLVLLNYKLIRALRQTRQKRDAMRNRSTISSNGAGAGARAGAGHGSSSRSEDDITLTLIIVVLVFVVSQSPALITQVSYSLYILNSRAGEGEIYLKM